MNEDHSPEQNAEFLRMALPLMSKYRIPASPENYAIWYQYVLGENPMLKSRIKELIEDGVEFTDEINHELFDHFGSKCNIKKIENIRGNLQNIMRDINGTLATADDSTERFGGNLQSFSASIGITTPLQDLQNLLGNLLEDTQHMQEVTRSLQKHIITKTREVETLQAELEQERIRSKSDPMTGLLNRSAFFETVAECIQDPDCSPGSLCLLMMDIDHFKAFNDSHGHLVGDRVLKFVAETIHKSVKGRDCAARYGGEEFALLLPSTPMDGAKKLARQLLSDIAGAKLMRADTKQPLEQVTISIGLAVYKTGEEMTEFIHRADQALYQAKNKGRNRLCTELTLKS